MRLRHGPQTVEAHVSTVGDELHIGLSEHRQVVIAIAREGAVLGVLALPEAEAEGIAQDIAAMVAQARLRH